MALKLQNNLKMNTGRWVGVTVAVFALLLQPFVTANLPAAFAVSGDAESEARLSALVVDATPPTVKVSVDGRGNYIGSGAFVRSGQRPEIEARDETAFDRSEIYRVSTGQKVGGPWTSTYAGVGWVGEGAYVVRAYDKAGNVSSDFAINIDNTAPTFEVSNIREGSLIGVNSESKLVVRGSFSDAFSGANYIQTQLVYKGLDRGVVTKHGAIQNGILAEFDTANLQNGGDYYIAVSAADVAGNFTERKIINFTLDATIPAVTFVDGDNTVYNPTAATEFKVTATDSEGIKRWYMQFHTADGKDLRIGRVPCAYGPGNTSATCRIDADLHRFEEGKTYYAVAFAEDAAGNIGTAQRAVIIDKTKPTIAINIVEGQINPSSYTLTANDENGITSVTAILRKTKAANGQEVATSCPKTMTSEFDRACAVPDNLPDGDYNIRYNATDKAGNLVASQQVNFVVDKEAEAAPAIVGVKGAGKDIKDGLTNSYNVELSWQAVVGATGYEYGYWNDIEGNPYKAGSPYLVSKSISQLSQSGAFTEGEGTHYLAVRSVSLSGLKSEWSVVPVVYDKTAPTITVESVGENSRQIAVSAADASKVRTIDVSLFGDKDGQINLANPIVLPHGAICTITDNSGIVGPQACALPDNLAPGTYWVRVDAVDMLDNSTTQSNSSFLPVEIPAAPNFSQPIAAPNPSGQTGQVAAGVLPATTAYSLDTSAVAVLPATDLDGDGQTDRADSATDSDRLARLSNGLTTEEDGEVLAATDERGCAKFLGICWYWWIPIGVGIVAIVWWGAYRHRAYRANV